MTTNTPIPCPACRAIDRADGVEDGNLYKIEHYHARRESALLQGLLRAQDRIADRTTGFAAPLRFEYIHTAGYAGGSAAHVGAIGAARDCDHFPYGRVALV